MKIVGTNTSTSPEGGADALELLLDGLSLPAFLFLSNGLLHSANARAIELLGRDALDFESRSFDSLFVPLPVRKGLLQLQTIGASSVAFCSFEFQSGPDFAGCVVLAVPEAEVRKQDDALEAMARLAGGVAHDFNNHLAAILGNAELAQASLLEGGDAGGYLSELIAAAERGKLVTQQLLAFSRNQVDRPREVELNLAVKQGRGLLSSILGRGVQLDLELGPDAGAIKIDPRHMERILTGIARVLRQRQPDLSVCRISTELVQEDTDRVCLRFCSGHDGIESRKENDPAGLLDVIELIHRAGGELFVEDEGHAVVVHFPALPERHECEVVARQESEQTQILLVEDDDCVRDVLERNLLRAGYQVRAVENGGRALEELRGGMQIDLLLTDIHMPGIHGVELYDRVVGLRGSTPVVFMSGLVEDQALREGLALGPHEFLQKPFTAKTLLRSVRNTLLEAEREEPKKVLVVDDEPLILELVSQLLDGEEYRCSVASSVEQAKRLLVNDRPDLVLCDMVMPDQDGLDLLRLIRRSYRSCSFVAMSGHMTRHGVLAAAKEMGAAFTLVKPFSRGELLAALSEAQSLRAS